MAEGAQKRKQGAGGAHGAGPGHKRSKVRSKGGSGGRWKTAHQKSKQTEKVDMGTALEVGDEGIWVTFARGMGTKAVREFRELCEEYGEKLYDIKPSRMQDASTGDEGQDEKDIEASIAEELSNIKKSQRPQSRPTFSPVSTGLECLFFMKTTRPVQPGHLVRKICEDARDCADPRQRKSRYINRLTPVFDTDKATETGIVRVARTVLAPWFSLKGEAEGTAPETIEPQGERSAAPAYTYAIRHNIRNHSTLRSGQVIEKIASLVDAKHKVNLGTPDKVILVEIFQLFCGISVVDGEEWEALKRYNVNALHGLAVEEKKDRAKTEEEAAEPDDRGRVEPS